MSRKMLKALAEGTPVAVTLEMTSIREEVFQPIVVPDCGSASSTQGAGKSRLSSATNS